MARVKAVFRPGDYPDTPDEAVRRDVAELFGTLFPGKADPEFDQHHAGMAIAALNPKLALHLAKLSGFIALELSWCDRRDLRELAIQAVHAHWKCNYSFDARIAVAEAAGISAKQQGALREGRERGLLDEEQQLVVDYARAVASGSVPDELFARVADRYGDQGAVELTTVAAFWSFWSLFLNATRPN